MTFTRTRLKYLCRLAAGATPSVDVESNWADDEEGFAWVSIGDMSTVDRVDKTARRVSERGVQERGLAIGPAGTLLFSMYASLGHTSVLGVRGAWNQAILGLFPRVAVDMRFIRYSLVGLRPYLAELARSNTQANLNAEQVGNLPISLPSLAEQQRIADCLDACSRKTDGVLEARRRQLVLLEERELSQIFAAVRGIYENGNRKDSGLRWLGDVPKDWPVLSVSSQFEILLGKMLNQERVQGEHLKPYLRNTNVQWDRIDTDDLLVMDFPPHERTRYEVRAGDLLICEGGQPGRSAIWDGRVEEIYYQKALHRARSRGRSSVRWLFYCLRAATALDVFAVEGNTTTIGHLTGEQLRVHRFPFPNRHVQDRMVRELDAAAVAVRRAQSNIRRQVELLAERRQALITAAVTGQIDVATMRGADV